MPVTNKKSNPTDNTCELKFVHFLSPVFSRRNENICLAVMVVSLATEKSNFIAHI